ncbi:MAG: ATP-binding protein [Saprospiraceae bacterium]|nr:ATP-binding protein [Saprospiraceae bacterium]MDW8230438.1 ATP-binding protein [Saprospiraceae bacterium]
MSYGDIFDKADKRSINTSIAREILEKMEKLRMEANENNQRRWIWELLQNAKDAANRGRTLNIKIELTDDHLIFSHNGRCFSAEDITFLIRQVSTKERTKEKEEGLINNGS